MGIFKTLYTLYHEGDNIEEQVKYMTTSKPCYNCNATGEIPQLTKTNKPKKPKKCPICKGHKRYIPPCQE